MNWPRARVPRLRISRVLEDKKKASFCNEALKGSLNQEVSKGPEETTGEEFQHSSNFTVSGFSLEIEAQRKKLPSTPLDSN